MGYTMRTQPTLLALIMALFIPLACDAQLTPLETSQHFWRAIEQRDMATLKLYVMSPGTLSDEPQKLAVSDITFGKIVIDGDAATVETMLTIQDDTAFRTQLETQLQKTEGAWKVDYDRTINKLAQMDSKEKMLGNIKELGKILSDSIDSSVQELHKQWPELKRQLEELEEKTKAKLPELEQKLDEIRKKIEEGFKNQEEKPEGLSI